MVARRYSRTMKQKGGNSAPPRQPKISRGSKIVTKALAGAHSVAKGTKFAVKGAASIVAAPIAVGLSVAKAGTVAAATAAISTPIRAIQGAIKTPWQLARLGVQKGKEWSARRKLTAEGMYNYDNLGNRVSKRTQTLNALRTQHATLNAQKLQKQMSGTDKGLSSWWSSRQLARKGKAITNAEARLTKSIEHKATRTGATNSNKIQNISKRAKKFIAELNTTKKRQMNAYNAKLTAKRNEKAKPINNRLEKLKSPNHDKRKAHTNAHTVQKNAHTALAASKTQLEAFTALQPTSFGTDGKGVTVIEGQTYTRDAAIAAAKELRDTIKTQTKVSEAATGEYNKSAKSVAALDAEAAKLEAKQKAYMSQGKTAEQLYGSFQRRKARVQNTKEELVKTAQQLTGIATGKNIVRAVKASFQQDFRLAKQAMGLSKNSGVKPGVLAAIGKSLTSSKKNLSSRYTAIKHGIEPIGLKIKTLWRGYVNNFSKQGKLLDKFATDVGEKGALAIEAQNIKEEYERLTPKDLVPPELRARHNKLINKREIMKNFANLIAKNRDDEKDPRATKFAESSLVAKGAAELEIDLNQNDQASLDANIKKAVNKYYATPIANPARTMYMELYNHLKSIKGWKESEEFNPKATKLVSKLDNLLSGLEVLPEFKPLSGTKEVLPESNPAPRYSQESSV